MTTLDEALAAAIMADMRLAAEREVLPRFLMLEPQAIRTKTAADDLVTDADIGAERLLAERLLARFPGAVVVGEEAVAADPSLLNRIGEAEWTIIIDPVDGTWNFAHGMPVFGMILALVRDGRTEAGIIHYPVTGDFILALRGQGAWHVKPNGARLALRVAGAKPVSAMDGFVALPWLPADEREALAPRVTRFSHTGVWRCSAYEYRLLAQGSADFMYNASLMPWDHAAGVLIHAEAGGYARLADGRAYQPSLTQGRLLLARDEASWRAIAEALGVMGEMAQP